MAKASDLKIKFHFDSLPIFEKAKEALKLGFLTKAHRTNFEYVAKYSNLGKFEGEKILFDPQTSGGLLLSVKSENAERFLNCLQKRFPAAAIIGKAEQKHGEIFTEITD